LGGINLTSRKRKHVSTTLTGIIDCTSRLSLTPDVTLALSPPGAVAIPSFHPCVRLSRWAKNPGTVSFIPPDGAFTLLDYETPNVNNVDVPIRIETKLDESGEFEVRLTPGGKKVEDLTVTIPLNPTITGTTNTRPSRGDFTTTTTALTWVIPNDKPSAGMLGGGRPGYVLKGQFTGEDMIPPSDVVVKFMCQGWLASGVTVGGLRVSGTGVADGIGSGRGGVFKGVKGITNVQVIVRL
jgi:AP-3 complex subunit mu